MKFNVVIEKDTEGGYVVSCPAIKGCHSQGETVKEALKNIKEAITGCLQTLKRLIRDAGMTNKRLTELAQS